MLRFCVRKQISYNSAHPKLYIDTKETMSCGGCYENVFLGTFHKMAHGLVSSSCIYVATPSKSKTIADCTKAEIRLITGNIINFIGLVRMGVKLF